eukprot:6203946-Pleurochrysis_carterae.AAC.2
MRGGGAVDDPDLRGMRTPGHAHTRLDSRLHASACTQTTQSLAGLQRIVRQCSCVSLGCLASSSEHPTVAFPRLFLIT